MPLFWVGDRIKAKLSNDSDVTCQSPDKICDTDTINRQGKPVIFKLVILTFTVQIFLKI